MPLYIIIFLVLGISCAFLGLFSKIIEITSEKTAIKFIQKMQLNKQ